MHNLWNAEDQSLLKCLKKEILSGPTLSRPYPSIMFHIRIDWSKYGTGAVILQADVSVESINPEAQERDGGKCEFDKYLVPHYN